MGRKTAARNFRAVALFVAVALALGGCVDDSREREQPRVAAPAGDGDQGGGDSGDGGTGDQPAPFDTLDMLTNLADAVIVPNYRSLAEQTAAFAAEDGPLAGYCEAIGTAGEDSSTVAARDAWRDAMRAVQTTEMHVFGPAADNSEALRKRVLSYDDAPLSTCGVDVAVVLAGEDGFDIRARALNQRGYGALEYLVFREDLTHTCAPQVPGTADWNALPETERRQARCGLARLIADDAADAAATLAERWDPDGGDYRATFLDPDAIGETLQHLTDGIFAMDLLVKDRKLGIPTGIHDDCSSTACPGLVESPHARNSFANIRANVVSFKTLFEGGDGLGFDDFIVNEDFASVADRFVTNTQDVVDYVDRIDTTLYEQVLSIEDARRESECMNAFAGPDRQAELSACTLTGLVKRVTDDLKIDFVTIVGVSIPGGAQTDND